MRYLITLSIFITLSFLFSCAGSSSESAEQDPQLTQANILHLEAMETEKEFKKIFNELENLKNSIQVQGRELNEEEMSFVDMMGRMDKVYATWLSNRIEVPGFEHAHDHDDGHHHHHHGTDVQLTPQQMFDVQEESLKTMNGMLERAKVLYERHLIK